MSRTGAAASPCEWLVVLRYSVEWSGHLLVEWTLCEERISERVSSRYITGLDGKIVGKCPKCPSFEKQDSLLGAHPTPYPTPYSLSLLIPLPFYRRGKVGTANGSCVSVLFSNYILDKKSENRRENLVLHLFRVGGVG